MIVSCPHCDKMHSDRHDHDCDPFAITFERRDFDPGPPIGSLAVLERARVVTSRRCRCGLVPGHGGACEPVTAGGGE